jgi:hypothetical protein
MIFRARDPMAQRLAQGMGKESNTTLAPERRPRNVASRAFGALALGAAAIGALAIGTLAIGRLTIGRARIRRLEIDELVVRRTRVGEDLQTPPRPGPEG